MYFFIQRMHDAKRNLKYASIFNGIYIKSMHELYDKYELPSLHLWEDGFCQGDASNNQCLELVKIGLASIIDAEDNTFSFEKLDKEFADLIDSKIEDYNNSYND